MNNDDLLKLVRATGVNMDALLQRVPRRPMPYPRVIGVVDFVWPWFLGGQHHGRSTEIQIDKEEYRRGCIEFPVRLPITIQSIKLIVYEPERLPVERYFLRGVGGYVAWVHEHHAHEICDDKYAMRWDPACWPNLSLCECTHDPDDWRRP